MDVDHPEQQCHDFAHFQLGLKIDGKQITDGQRRKHGLSMDECELIARDSTYCWLCGRSLDKDVQPRVAVSRSEFVVLAADLIYNASHMDLILPTEEIVPREAVPKNLFAGKVGKCVHIW